MAEPNDRPAYSFNPGSPPEASRFLKNKALLTSFSWQDVEPEEHAVMFTVAKGMAVDVVSTIRDEVQRAIDEGVPFEEFQATLRPRLRRLGWWGKKEKVDPVTGEAALVQLGSPRRLQVIYNANLRSARAAGQWERIERTKRAFPYLEYMLGPSEHHRPAHQAKQGLIIPVDSPFWNSWMPPNGWECKCWVRQVTRSEAERRGVSDVPDIPVNEWTNKRTGEVQEIPAGIDPGWQRNPGKLRMQAMEQMLEEKLDAAHPVIRRAALKDIASSWRVQRILKAAAPGSAPIAVMPEDLATRLGAKSRMIKVSADTAEKQADHHPDLTPEDYGQLVELLGTGKVVGQTQDTHLAFVGQKQDQPWVAIVKRTADGNEMFLVSLYRAASARYVRRLLSRGEIWRE